MQIRRFAARKALRFGVLRVKALLDGPGGKRLSVQHVRMGPRAKAPALCHRRTDEIFFVVSGTVSGRIGGKKVSLRKGDCAFLPAGTVHEFEAGRGGVEVLDVFFPGLDLKRPDVEAAG
ncbi:MAG: cupin domain-containing protein [Elusimicrobia bacterium]|nr:cupin domain-containing protein [Elusimicrobiota bacterium]